MNNYMIAGPLFTCMFGYDERTSGKGPNEVMSFLRMWLVKEKERKPGLTHAVFWCDACGGQMWNEYMMLFIHELIDPSSALYVPGIKRIDIKCATSGHSFLWADRAIVPIKRRARSTLNGIVASFITDALPPVFHKRTWEFAILGCTTSGKPYDLTKVC